MELMSGNPLFKRLDGASDSSGSMTMAGVKAKTGLALGLVMASAAYTYMNFSAVSGGFLVACALLAFVVGLVISFNPKTASVLALVYALLEGIVLGAVSGMSDHAYPGIVLNALVGTFVVFMGMLALYRSGNIKVNTRFRAVVSSALMGIVVIYLVSFVLSMFGVHQSITNGSGLISILFSCGVCVVAAMTLAVDFDDIADGCASGAPKYMEWFSAFALMVTVIWLYLEILNLLQKLKERD